VEEVHDICDRIEEEVVRRLPGAVVTIHMEPADGRYLGPREP
jgi:divalent metal cation (Fe/Co/Zn/Cd) transporter